MAHRKYNHEKIYAQRLQGASWDELAAEYDATPKQVMKSHGNWRKRTLEGAHAATTAAAQTADLVRMERLKKGLVEEGEEERNSFNAADWFTKSLTGEELAGLHSLEDLALFFDVDPDVWQVKDFDVKGGTHQQHSVKKGFVTLHNYTLRVRFERRPEAVLEAVEDVWQDILRDIREHAPRYKPIIREADPAQGRRVTAVLMLTDPHLAMLAWGREVGHDYDAGIAVRDYERAVEKLLGVAQTYRGLDEICYVGGNDFLHADITGPGKKGGATASGTPQDMDTRPSRMFTLGRKALIAGVDAARLVAPVELYMVPGNHDPENVYKLGEVAEAWFRHDSEVTVHNEPRKRKFYGYGQNAIMLTHGEEFRRKRDNLVTIMATECPPEMWVASHEGLREVLTGHNHAFFAGGYYPLQDAQESRGVRVISCSGMTAVDSWHYEQGYSHHRAATLRVYYHDGGLAGHHEEAL